MNTPEISIVLLSYNHAPYVGMAIESVIAQSFGDWELVIVDDASQDVSWEIIGMYSDSRIRKVRFDKNRGAAAAYEASRALCGGEFLAHIDSDDAWLPGKLERQRAFLEERKVDLCCTPVIEIDAAGKRSGSDFSNWFNAECDLSAPETWIWQNRICHSSILMRRSLHEKVGALNSDLIYTPDWELWVRCLRAGGRIARLEEPLTMYRGHQNNITRRNPARMFREYAFISAFALHPWYYACGRPDLVGRNIQTFMLQEEFQKLSTQETQSIMHLLCDRRCESERFSAIYDDETIKVRSEETLVDDVVLGILGNCYSPGGKSLFSSIEKRNLQIEKLRAEKMKLKSIIEEMRNAAERRRLRSRLRSMLGFAKAR